MRNAQLTESKLSGTSTHTHTQFDATTLEHRVRHEPSRASPHSLGCLEGEVMKYRSSHNSAVCLQGDVLNTGLLQYINPLSEYEKKSSKVREKREHVEFYTDRIVGLCVDTKLLL